MFIAVFIPITKPASDICKVENMDLSADIGGDNHTLTGLVRDDTYIISITASIQTLSSSPVAVEVALSQPVAQFSVL